MKSDYSTPLLRTSDDSHLPLLPARPDPPPAPPPHSPPPNTLPSPALQQPLRPARLSPTLGP